jgi:hypothetical protein
MRTKPVAHHNFHEKRFTKFMRRKPGAHHNLHKKSFPKIPKFMRRKPRAHHNFHEKNFTKSMRGKTVQEFLFAQNTMFEHAVMASLSSAHSSSK